VRASTASTAGNRVDPGDAALVHELPESGAVEPSVEHQRGTGDQGREHSNYLRIHVRQRQRVEPAVIGGSGPWVLTTCSATKQQLRLGQFDALGWYRSNR